MRTSPSRFAFANAVTETTHGFNRARGLAQFFSEATHMGIDGAGINHTFVTPDFVEEAVAFLDSSLAAHEHAEQLKLHARETNGPTRHVNVMPRRIQRNRSDGYALFLHSVAFA